ncbi:VOC family protein [Thermocrispum municipale]|jgi:hypothetical protein|uniref:VOC family protein n=1 Tax=Thermocrispum municipale TaxID=37926 RepID=UPI0004296273|nr:VOC family protein [Thermocrispum municipale]
MPNPVVHFEIGTKDSGRARSFYRALFGWQPAPGGPEYWLIPPEGDGIGGGIREASDQVPTYITFYVQVDDIRASVAKARELGGQVIVAPTPIPGVGEFALFADPDGNTVGLMTPIEDGGDG